MVALGDGMSEGESRGLAVPGRPVTIQAVSASSRHIACRSVESDPGHGTGLPAQLEALSPKQRQAVLMVHAFGYSVRETAHLLAVAPSTVQKNADRGMAHLREGLGVSVDA